MINCILGRLNLDREEMKRKLVLLLMIISWSPAVTSCLPSVPLAPERDFAIEYLLLDLSVFPEGWYVNRSAGPTPSGDGAILAEDSIEISYKANGPVLFTAMQEVYRFRSVEWAAQEYRDQLPILFNNNSAAMLTTWELPNELPYQSLAAAQSHFACGQSEITNQWGCRFLGQYDEYLVIFSTFIGEEMTYTDLDQILKAIDERMANYLAKGDAK